MLSTRQNALIKSDHGCHLLDMSDVELSPKPHRKPRATTVPDPSNMKGLGKEREERKQGNNNTKEQGQGLPRQSSG